MNIRSDAANLEIESRPSKPSQFDAESSKLSRASTSNVIAATTSNNVGQDQPVNTYKMVLSNMSPM